MSRGLHLAGAPTESSESAASDLRVRVVLADDHAPMRRSLRMLLDDERDIDVVGEARKLTEVAAVLQGTRPHVLVLDLGMRGGSCIEAISQLRELLPKTQIVATTMEDSPAFARHALAAGALGFVSKELADAEAPQAVRAAARGQEYISPRVAPLWTPVSARSPRAC